MCAAQSLNTSLNTELTSSMIIYFVPNFGIPLIMNTSSYIHFVLENSTVNKSVADNLRYLHVHLL